MPLSRAMALASGIESAAATSDLPMTRNQTVSTLTAENVTGPGADETSVHRITTQYFETLGIPFVAGRDFAPADRAGPPVAIVTQAFARAFWGEEPAVGRRFRFDDADGGGEWLTIVGVVGDVHQLALGQPAGPAAYLYHERSPFVFGNVVLRGSAEPGALAAAVRREVQALDPRQPITSVGSLTDQMWTTVTEPRFNTTLLAVFGLVAMVIAGVGVFGAVSYIVRQRTNEVGIRMALGASRHRVLALVMRQGLSSVAVGVLVGLAASVPLARALEAMVFGIGTTDAPTYATVAGVLMATAALACWLPARRAVRVHPATTLRA